MASTTEKKKDASLGDSVVGKDENVSAKIASSPEPRSMANEETEPQSPSPQTDGAGDGKESPAQYKMFSRPKNCPTHSNSSAGSSRAQSPVSFGYLYRQNMHGGSIFGDAQTPQAILS